MALLARSGASAVAVLCLCLLHARPAPAQTEPARDIPPISFEVLVAYALDQQGPTDAPCQELKRRLPMQYGSLTTFERRTVRVVFGDHASVSLPTGDIMFMPILVHNRVLHTQFQMEGRMNMRMMMTNGKAAIFGPMRFQDGYLIVQVVPDFSTYIDNPPAGGRGPKLYQVSDKVKKAPPR